LQVYEAVIEDLQKAANAEKAAFLPRFFQALPGGYGEGDRFIGVTVPDQRRTARKHYRSITLTELLGLFESSFHEHRLTALFILVAKYEKAVDENERELLAGFYLANLDAVNNWDLVDSSAYKILGPFLEHRDRSVLYDLARSRHLWRERIAIITTYYFIKKGQFKDTFEIADLLINHEHDLIHKAVGWMLREVGNRDYEAEFNFLKPRYKDMPRTMLRYAIEKFVPATRKQFLKGTI